ncbi:14657_t:CDS:2 [Ambispora leptoticha]|uniref:14657_t:CDS:1 n=1 Tax=Ambispora leptoticha TaxID=144679 RepID=A0A9N9DR46_9GLOM|nr:14657_t:CDS:2 [Ambispora leptoticha]
MTPIRHNSAKNLIHLVPLDERFNEMNQSNKEAGDETGEQRTHKINLENNETTKEEYKLKLGDEIAQGMFSHTMKINGRLL